MGLESLFRFSPLKTRSPTVVANINGKRSFREEGSLTRILSRIEEGFQPQLCNGNLGDCFFGSDDGVTEWT